MKRLRLWIPAGILLMMCAGTASATPINFQLDNVTTVGGALPSLQTYSPDFPIPGSGDIDFVAGTGTLTLVDYSTTIDTGFSGPNGVTDVRLDIANWSQTITAIDGLGNISSIGGGTVTCTSLGGLGGLICPSVPPTVAGWPAADGPLAPSSAVIDLLAQTIVVIDNSNAQAGTVTQFFSYSVVPEPGTALLIGGGLIGLAMGRGGRRQRAC